MHRYGEDVIGAYDESVFAMIAPRKVRIPRNHKRDFLASNLKFKRVLRANNICVIVRQLRLLKTISLKERNALSDIQISTLECEQISDKIITVVS